MLIYLRENIVYFAINLLSDKNAFLTNMRFVKNKKWYEIVINKKCKIHKANYNLIGGYSKLSISEIENNARKYWSSENTSDINNVEVLIDGIVNIKEIK